MSYQYVATASSVAAGGTTETIAVTSPLPDGGVQVGKGYVVSGAVNLTSGSAATAAVVKVHRGTSTAGTAVWTATSTISATSSYTIPFCALDNLGGENSVQQYCVAVSQTSATSNGTFNVATIEVEAISS